MDENLKRQFREFSILVKKLVKILKFKIIRFSELRAPVELHVYDVTHFSLLVTWQDDQQFAESYEVRVQNSMTGETMEFSTQESEL
jgi:hypothetical protein